MYDEPGGFLNHGELLVLVKDSQRDRLGLELHWLRRRNVDLDAIAGLELVARLGRSAIHLHVFLVDQALGGGTGKAFAGFREPGVEAGLTGVIEDELVPFRGGKGGHGLV
jgi:hypothetical protein